MAGAAETAVGRIIQTLIPSFSFSSSTISGGAFRTSAGQTCESDGTRYTARLNKGFRIGEDGVLHAAVEFSHRDPTNRPGLSGSRQYSNSVIDENNVLTMDPGNKERNFNRRNFLIGDAELDQVSGAFDYSNSQISYPDFSHLRTDILPSLSYRPAPRRAAVPPGGLTGIAHVSNDRSAFPAHLESSACIFGQIVLAPCYARRAGERSTREAAAAASEGFGQTVCFQSPLPEPPPRRGDQRKAFRPFSRLYALCHAGGRGSEDGISSYLSALPLCLFR